MSYFIPRNNRLFSFAIQIRHRYRYPLSIIALMIFMYIWHNTTYQLLAQRILQKKAVVNQLRVAKNTHAGVQKQTTRIEKKIRNLSKQLEQYEKNSNSEYALQHMIQTTLHHIHNTQLTLTSYTTEKDSHTKEYRQYTAHFGLQGNHAQLQKFFTILADEPFLVECTRAHLTQKDKNLFAMSCTLSFYLLQNSKT